LVRGLHVWGTAVITVSQVEQTVLLTR
jgi:hypothetical protein